MTSSFFWSSPWMLDAPWSPVMLEIPARCTRDAICLHAREMLESTMVSSPSMTPACSCFNNHVVNVVMSYWLFFCCLGTGGSKLTAAALAEEEEEEQLTPRTLACCARRPARDPYKLDEEEPGASCVSLLLLLLLEEEAPTAAAGTPCARRMAWVAVAIAATDAATLPTSELSSQIPPFSRSSSLLLISRVADDMRCDAMRVSEAGTDSFWVATPQKLREKLIHSPSTHHQNSPQSISIVSSSRILLP